MSEFPEAFVQITTAKHSIFAESAQAWTRCLSKFERDSQQRVKFAMNHHYKQ